MKYFIAEAREIEHSIRMAEHYLEKEQYEYHSPYRYFENDAEKAEQDKKHQNSISHYEKKLSELRAELFELEQKDEEYDKQSTLNALRQEAAMNEFSAMFAGSLISDKISDKGNNLFATMQKELMQKAIEIRSEIDEKK